MNKKSKILTMSVLVAVLSSTVVNADGKWKKNETGYWYENDDKSYSKNQWKKIDNIWYYFNENGYMATGWKKIDGKWYFLKSSGSMASNEWIGDYYLTSSGSMAVDIVTPDGYTVDKSGKWNREVARFVGKWVYENEKWWYKNPDGSYPKNRWQKIDDQWYYFDEEGYMKADSWVGDYYVGKNGAMLSETTTPDGKKVDKNGKLIVEDEKEEEEIVEEIETDKVIVIEDKNLEKILLRELKNFSGTSDEDSVLKISDANYRKNKDSNEILKSDLEKIEEIKIEFEEINSIKGLEYAKNLKSLVLSFNGISDLNPIKDIVTLENLILDYNKIEDLNPIKNLKNIETLDITSNKLKDLKALEGLYKIKTLRISNPKEEDSQELNENRLTDISEIGKLSTLENLTLSHNSIEDISPLVNLKNLKTLAISHNLIEDISELSKMTQLVNLDISKNRVKNIDALTSLTNLETLTISGGKGDHANKSNEISNITPIKDLKNLKYFWSVNNSIIDISPLEKLEKLEDLNLTSNKIENLMSISKLVKLKNLELGENKIQDLTFLKDLVNLETLGLKSNMISNLDGISKAVNLQNLDLSNNRLSDISVIENFKNLAYIAVNDNQIRDLSLVGKVQGYVKKIGNQIVGINQKFTIENSKISVDNPFIGIDKILETAPTFSTNIEGMNAVYNKEANKIEVDIPSNYKGENIEIIITYDDENIFKITGITAEEKKIEPILIHTVRFNVTTLNEGETALKGKVFGENVEGLKIFSKEVVDGEEKDTSDVTMEIDQAKSNKTKADVTLNFLPNNSNVDKKYKIYFGRENAIEDKFVEITVKGKPATKILTEITFAKFTDLVVEQGTNSVEGKIFGKNLKDAKIYPKEIVNDQELPTTDVTMEILSSTEKNANIKLKFAENSTENDKKYKIYFGGETQGDVSVEVVAHPVEDKPEIFSVMEQDVLIENAEDDATVRVLGKNLNENVKIFVKKIVADVETDSEDIVISAVSGKGKGSKTLKLKSNKFYAEDTKYKVYFGYEDKTEYFATITVKGNSDSTGDTPDVQPKEETFKFVKAYYKADGQTFRIEFEEELKVDNIEDLKSKIKFVTEGNKKSLTANDLVSVSGKNINIILENKMDAFTILFTKIEMPKAAVKSVTNKVSEAVDSNLVLDNSSQPKLEGYDIKNKVIESTGGIVTVEFNGKNLNVNSTKIKLLDVETRSAASDINSNITYEMSGDKLIAKINIPANSSSKAKSYNVSITNEKNQPFGENTEVITVLGEGQNPTEIVFSNIDIKSYKNNQSVGSGKINVKHTEVSEGQNSKKTWGNIYGANLDYKKIDVIITDSTGVTWTLTESTIHGKEKFYKYLDGVPTNTVSIKGSGTVVFYEIILPNNLPEDRTFTYKFVIDGKVIEESAVTAFIKKAK